MPGPTYLIGITMTKTSLAVLAFMVAGCSTPTVKQEFSFTKSPAEAFDCAVSAARDIGLGIESSDAATGVFSAMTSEMQLGGLVGGSARQYYFAVDKKLKTVSVRVESFNQINTDVAPVQKQIADFQASFRKRCA